MKKNIVFVSIFDLTRVYFEVSKELESRGHRTFWITTGDEWTEWLTEQGVDRRVILRIVYQEADFLSDTEKDQLRPQIIACEANADLSVNQCLLADRFVLYKNKANINDYIYLYYRDIKRFLTDNKITHVFAEPTNTNELITYMICRELGIPFLQAHETRFPLGRLVFTEGYLQEKVIGENSQSATHDDIGKQALGQFAENHTTPLSFQVNCKERVIRPRKVLRSTINRLNFVRRGDRANLAHHDLGERLQAMRQRLVNGFYMRHLCRYDNLEQVRNRIAFYPLHVQPESSVDVLGSYFSDQLKLVKDIRRALPFDTTLVVKEHPNFLGLKKIGFFTELRRIPNVVLIRHDISNFDVYKRAAIIFTVSGTAAYEAGMLGIPAVTFSPMFFGGFSSVNYCPEITRLKPLVHRLLTQFERDYHGDCQFMGDLMQKSFEGYFVDPLTYPEAMDEANLDRLKSAFVKAVEDSSVA